MLRYKRMTSIFFLQQLFGTKDDSALRESLRALRRFLKLSRVCYLKVSYPFFNRGWS